MADSYSQSTSESNSLGLQNKFGAFNNGGGLRIPTWTWPVAVVGLIIIGVVWLNKKK